MNGAGDEKHCDDKPLAPGLYLVATPIGNLEDITLRALRVLRSADRIACEDTRQTQKLLNHFAIRTPTVSYHQHNEASRTDELIAKLKSGARIAVVSDAGTPGIADPGAEIASAAIAAGIPVFPIPGANAALSALVASGLLGADSGTGPQGKDSAAFSFHGFLPAKQGQRRTALESLRIAPGGNVSEPRTSEAKNRTVILSETISHTRDRGVEGPAVGQNSVIPSEGSSNAGCEVEGPASAFLHRAQIGESPIHIFYEAPHRILATLADIEAVFGPAQHIVLARELTKLHEEFLRGAVSELRKTLTARATIGNIKGEFVVLFTPAQSGSPIRTLQRTGGDAATNGPVIPQPSIAAASIASEVRGLMQSENLSEMDALKRVARARGLSKSAAYREWQRSRGK